MHELATDLLAKLEKQHLVLPSLPEVAFKICDAVKNPNTTIPMLVKIVSSDPALSANLISLANSAFMQRMVKVDTIAMAITRLGIQNTRNITLSLEMKHLFHSKHPLIKQKLHDELNKSIEVAAISRTLAAHVGEINQDEVALAGLTHNIGALPLLVALEQKTSPEMLIALYNTDELLKLQGKLGSSILTSWHFPEELIEIPQKIATPNINPLPLDISHYVFIGYLETLPIDESEKLQLRSKYATIYQAMGLDITSNLRIDPKLASAIESARSMFMC